MRSYGDLTTSPFGTPSVRKRERVRGAMMSGEKEPSGGTPEVGVGCLAQLDPTRRYSCTAVYIRRNTVPPVSDRYGATYCQTGTRSISVQIFSFPVGQAAPEARKDPNDSRGQMHGWPARWSIIHLPGHPHARFWRVAQLLGPQPGTGSHRFRRVWQLALHCS